MTTVPTPALASGSMTLRKIVSSLAPSRRAASIRSSGKVAKNARIRKIENGDIEPT